MSEWNAAQYMKFEKERTQPSFDLLNRVQLANPADALDVGCGPGNSTKAVRQRFPGAKVTGIDSSPAMISRAAADYPEFDFRLCGVPGSLKTLGTQYDLVFSNACIQWIPEHHALIPALFALVRGGGVLAVQTPMNAVEPAYRIIDEVSALPRFRGNFSSLGRDVHNLSPEEYCALLGGISEDFSAWQTRYYYIFESPEKILEWVRATRLRPFLQALPDIERTAYEREILGRIKDAYPPQRDGSVIFRFLRFFFVASK